ncbi:hypothetical protein GGR42_000411 [Saonia flava]|uniref:Uncharacterized protein n=1 Tax=Saonia flava TaxID=523696 RepID=A0A846QZD2_9FLAO|nr:hypothetical protein [Saonia flava]NJB69949.1 hypothetical protein [Saonia flava]
MKNKSINKIVAITTMALAVSLVQGQDYLDLVSISYFNTPSNSFKNSQQSTQLQQLDMQLDFPIVANEKMVFLTGFSSQANTLLLNPDNESESTIGFMAVEMGINLVHSEKISGTYLVIPKLASDFGSINKKDFQLGFLGLINLKKTEHLSYKFGLYVNTEKFGLFLVPLLGSYYKSPNNKLEVNAILPASVDVNYKITPTIWAGIYFESLSGSYYLNNNHVNSSNQYVNKSSNELYLYLGIPLTKSLILKPKLGHSIGRAYRTFDVNDKVSFSLSSIYFGDNRTQLNQDFKDGPIVELELVYRFHFKK